jgi:hypothetical protein
MCEQYFSVHHPRALEKLQQGWGIPRDSEGNTLWGQVMWGLQPLDEVCGYFGSAIAWYFVYMGFYTRALVLPSVVGALVFVLSLIDPTIPTLALYSIFIAIWTTMFLELWGREEAKTAYDWDVDEAHAGFEEEDSQEFVKQMRHLYMDKNTAKANLENLEQVLTGVGAATIKRDIEDL